MVVEAGIARVTSTWAKGQAFGQRAKQATSALIYGKEVTLQTHGKDKYGRTVADVLLPDGGNVNQQLVREGWCWWYQKQHPRTLRSSNRNRRRKKRNGDYGVTQILSRRGSTVGCTLELIR